MSARFVATCSRSKPIATRCSRSGDSASQNPNHTGTWSAVRRGSALKATPRTPTAPMCATARSVATRPTTSGPSRQSRSASRPNARKVRRSPSAPSVLLDAWQSSAQCRRAASLLLSCGSERLDPAGCSCLPCTPAALPHTPVVLPNTRTCRSRRTHAMDVGSKGSKGGRKPRLKSRSGTKGGSANSSSAAVAAPAAAITPVAGPLSPPHRQLWRWPPLLRLL